MLKELQNVSGVAVQRLVDDNLWAPFVAAANEGV